VPSSSGDAVGGLITADDGLTQLIENFDSQRRIQDSVVLVAMEQRAKECAESALKVAGVRSSFNASMLSKLKRSAEVQTAIHKLKKRIELMAKLYKGHNEYFSHLRYYLSYHFNTCDNNASRSIADLPMIYDAFLCEIVRRRQFTAEYDSCIGKAVDEVEMLTSSIHLRHRLNIHPTGKWA